MIVKLVVLVMLAAPLRTSHLCKHHHRFHQVTCANFSITEKWENHLVLEANIEKFVLKNVNGSLHFSEKFVEVTYFTIGHSEIHNISFSTFPNLVFLSFVDNRKFPNLTETFFEHTDHINWLALISNNHSVSANSLHRLRQLTWFHIQNQKLVHLTGEFFAQNHQLHELTIRNCQLEIIDANAFDNTPELEVLGLNNNKITSFQIGTFANLTKLKILELHHNSFANFDLGQFGGLVALEVVGLPTNLLKTIDDVEELATAFPNLKKLEMRKKDLTMKQLEPFVEKIREKKIQIIGTPHDCHLPSGHCNIVLY